MSTTNELLNQYYEQSVCTDEPLSSLSLSHSDKYYKDWLGDWSHQDIDSGNSDGNGGSNCLGCGCCATIMGGLVLCNEAGWLPKIMAKIVFGVCDVISICCC